MSPVPELFRTFSNNLWSLWRKDSDGWRALIVSSHYAEVDGYLRGYHDAIPATVVRSGSIREIEPELASKKYEPLETCSQ